jgi:hypothetical protein
MVTPVKLHKAVSKWATGPLRLRSKCYEVLLVVRPMQMNTYLTKMRSVGVSEVALSTYVGPTTRVNGARSAWYINYNADIRFNREF